MEELKNGESVHVTLEGTTDVRDLKDWIAVRTPEGETVLVAANQAWTRIEGQTPNMHGAPVTVHFVGRVEREPGDPRGRIKGRGFWASVPADLPWTTVERL